MYVAQRLNRAAVEDADEKRSNRFFADARLRSSERAELSDYKGSGYSREHMAPAGGMPTPTAKSRAGRPENVNASISSGWLSGTRRSLESSPACVSMA